MTVLEKHVDLVAGDDYKLADQRALLWECGDWPDLSGSVLTMVVGHRTGIYYNLPLTWTSTMAAGLATQRAIVELTGLQTGALAPDEYDYSLTATLANGDKVTLALGHLTACASPGRVASA